MRPFYAQFVKPGDLAFDVGANFGSRTRVFLQLGARVVAVEPQRECARALFAKFYDQGAFHLVNKAAGAANGRAEMLVHESRFRAQSWTETRMVGVVTLDTLIAKYGMPAFVKVDVEGFEYEVMRGLSQPPAALSLEFHPAFLEPALQSIEYLQRLGSIRLNCVLAERFEWVLNHWVAPEEMVTFLKRYPHDAEFVCGDVYVRFDER